MGVEEKQVNEQAENTELAETLEKVGSGLTIAANLVTAIFDPTGISIVVLVTNVAPTALEETAYHKMRNNWKEYFCPAMREAFIKADPAILSPTELTEIQKVEEHYGPIINNIDCEERTEPTSCKNTMPPELNPMKPEYKVTGAAQK